MEKVLSVEEFEKLSQKERYDYLKNITIDCVKEGFEIIEKTNSEYTETFAKFQKNLMKVCMGLCVEL